MTDGVIRKKPERSEDLPPITHVKQPEARTWSAKIRWALDMGWTVKEIANGWGLRYQMVRNVKVTEPKRAAREDVPELEYELLDPVNDVQAIMDAELDRSLAAGRAKKKVPRGTAQADEALDRLTAMTEEAGLYDMDQLDPDELEALKGEGGKA